MTLYHLSKALNALQAAGTEFLIAGGLAVIDLFAKEPFDFNHEYNETRFIELPGIDEA
jgi:hypothetical protein